MKRRDFLVKSTLFASTLLTVSKASSSPIQLPQKKPTSVLIIGAGFAGLAAGLALKKAGVKVTILEARNRIGGRVYSFLPKTAGGQVIELGAEWVGASHERVIALCGEYGLTLDNNQFESDLILNGKHAKTDAWAMSEKMEKFWNDLVPTWNAMPENDRKKLDKQDWWRYLQKAGLSQDDLFIRDLIDSTDFGESIRHTSAFAAFAEYAESSEKNEMDFKIRGGNSSLIEKMAGDIGHAHILLQQTVKEVNQKNKKEVVVTCLNGVVYKADKLICTTPTNSLMKIMWNPGLPVAYIEALHALQYARIGKFPIVCTERFWQREDFDMITDTPAHYFYHGTKNQPGKTGVLMCYATGDKADVLASVNVEQRLNIITDALQPAFGNIKKYIAEDLVYYWGKDLYSLGAYAFYGKNQWFEVMPQLQKPFNRTFFAGEHLADWQGFMEGAINSGEEAALNCLK